MLKIITFFIIAATRIRNSEEIGLLQVRIAANPDIYVSTEQTTFLQAYGFCKSNGQSLAAIDSPEKNTYFDKVLGTIGISEPAKFWISAYNQRVGPVQGFRWLGGLHLEYNNFETSPSEAPEDEDMCVVYNYNGAFKTSVWGYEKCSLNNNFICVRSF